MFVRRVLVVAVVVVGAIACAASAASAHVTVDPPSAPQGGTVKLSFLAPNEEPTATVTRVQIFFPVPPATPIPTVTVEPKPGWSFHLTIQRLTKPIVTDDGSISDIVSEIDWKALTPSAAIGAHEFGEFTIDADGLPDHETQVTFKALQTYSNGDVVRWIETGADAEHPAPVLQLTSPTGSTSASATTTSTAATASTTDDSARTIAIIALIVGALGLVAGIGAIVLRRRTT